MKIKVSLLFKELTVAKKFADIFRNMDIIPSVYTSLNDLWFDVLKERPSLCIVDVCMISEKDLILKDHPSVVHSQLNLAFFYKKSMQPLLMSTFNITHWGFISDYLALDIQVKAILDRVNIFNNIKESNKQLRKSHNKSNQALQTLYTERNIINKIIDEQKFIRKIIEESYQFVSSSNFYDFLNNTLEKINVIQKFALLEISESKQRLISPQIISQKYIEVPSVWLGKSLEDGIDFYSNNMASQVFIDLVDNSMQTLNIHGVHSGSDILLSISFHKEYRQDFNNINWQEFESFLSNIYKTFKLKNSSNQTSIEASKEINVWDFLDIISNYYFSHFEIEQQDKTKTKSLIAIDFEKLWDYATQTNYTKFYWKKFKNDFMSELSRKIKINLKYTCFESKIIILLNKIDMDHAWLILNSLTQNFQYWKYFDEVDSILAKNICPNLREIIISPASITNVLKSKYLYNNKEETKEIFKSDNFITSKVSSLNQTLTTSVKGL